MLGLTIFSVLGVALSAEINAVNMGKTMLELSGYQLLVKEVFLISAGSLGSCFQNLQKISAVISDGTYDPKVQSTYWTRWVMGVISAVVLSQLIYGLFRGRDRRPIRQRCRQSASRSSRCLAAIRWIWCTAS
jgi:hypothetical protein